MKSVIIIEQNKQIKIKNEIDQQIMSWQIETKKKKKEKEKEKDVDVEKRTKRRVWAKQ